jgi:hypothetical protein
MSAKRKTKSAYQTQDIGGVAYYNVKEAPEDKKLRYLNSTVGHDFVLKGGQQYAEVILWDRFDKYDSGLAKLARNTWTVSTSLLKRRYFKWSRNSNVLSVYAWAATLLAVALAYRVIFSQPHNVSIEYASHVLEIFGTAFTFIGTLWMVTGVTFTPEERDKLVKLKARKGAIKVADFDIPSALLLAASRAIEGIKIVTLGGLLLAVHLWFSTL